MEATATVLTREHIKFIRSNPKHVVFRYVNEENTVEIENEIGAVLKLTAEFSYRGYGNSKTGCPERTCRKAFAMIHTPSFTQEWVTVAALLKPGDRLECEWLADTNGYVKVATFAGDAEIEAFNGLHLDQMKLVILRGKQRLTFHMCNSVCPSNTARMFQY